MKKKLTEKDLEFLNKFDDLHFQCCECWSYFPLDMFGYWKEKGNETEQICELCDNVRKKRK